MISLRPYRPLDEDFLYHSWLSSLDRSVKGVNNAVRPLIDKVVSDGTILVACSEEDSDHILGWAAWTIVADEPVFLYLFIKKGMRSNGLGSRLFSEAFREKLGIEGPVSCAFWSFWVQRYSLKQQWGLRYNALFLPVILSELCNAKAKTERKH